MAFSLNHFSNVKELTGENQYICNCPSHEDRNSSLTIKILPDKVLLNCFAGCTPEDIMTSAGMNYNDLFFNDSSEFKQKKQSIFKRNQFMLDMTLIKIAEFDALKKKPFNAKYQQSIKSAIQRVQQYNFDAEQVFQECLGVDEEKAVQARNKAYDSWIYDEWMEKSFEDWESKSFKEKYGEAACQIMC